MREILFWSLLLLITKDELFFAEKDNGAFFRVEGTYSDYEDVTFLGTFNGNATGDSAVRNKIDADIDAVALRISLGKSF